MSSDNTLKHKFKFRSVLCVFLSVLKTSMVRGFRGEEVGLGKEVMSPSCGQSWRSLPRSRGGTQVVLEEEEAVKRSPVHIVLLT